MRVSKTMACAMVAAIGLPFAAVAASQGWLKWNGPATGGVWNDPANWKVTDGTLTAAELLATECSYDFTGLGDGAELTNTVTNIKLAKLDWRTGNVGTVKIFGEDILLMGAPEIYVATGNTLDWRVGHAQNWNQPDGSTKIILLGNGTFRCAPEKQMWFYQREIQPCNTVKFVIASPNCQFYNMNILQWNNSTVRLECDAKVGHFATPDSGCALDLNGHTLTVCGGESMGGASADTRVKYNGRIYGDGKIEWKGGDGVTVAGTGALDLTGSLGVYDGRVTIGKPFAANPVLALQGNGVFAFPDSATVGGVRGEGALGRVTLPEGATLTVADETNAVFNGSITGAVNVVKSGSAEWTLAGANRWEGTTQVGAGTLTLRRASARKGLVAHWGFENAAALGGDSGSKQFDLPAQVHGDGSLSPTQAADGVSGGALDFPLTENGDYHFERRLDSIPGIPQGTGPYSLDFWMRTTGLGGASVPYVLGIGSWADFRQIGVWLTGKNLIVCCGNYSTTDSPLSPVFNWPELFNGAWHHVAVTYEDRVVNVYGDGVLRKTKTLQSDLQLVGSGTLTFGNKDGSANFKSHRFVGGLDEVRLWNRALTAEEVAEAFARKLPTEAECDPSVALPAPVCHWAFDDAAAIGKDSAGSADLVGNPNIAAPAVVTGGGAYGCALTRGSSMMLPAANLPADFPRGDVPFTVSVRLRPGTQGENVDVMAFGDTSATVKCFRLWITSSPREIFASCGDYAWHSTGGSHTSTENVDSWLHIVVTYCGGKTTVYRDGRKVSEQNTVRPALAAGDLWLNCTTSRKSAHICQLDDVRIYREALSAQEVLALNRSLADGKVGQPLADGKVTIREGATLKAAGAGLELASLAGAGELRLQGGSSLSVADAVGFTGTAVGGGTLVLSGAMPNATLQCDVALKEDGAFVVPESGATYVKTTGRVRIPAKGTLTFDAQPQERIPRCVIAEGAKIEAPDGIAGWTSNLSPNMYHVTFAIEDQAFVANVRLRGLTIILK